MAAMTTHPIVTQLACEAKHHIERADLKTLVKVLRFGNTHAVCSWKSKRRMIETEIRKRTRALAKAIK